ncbi:MAG: translation elongation factor Ts [Dehalococcoidia bacterium]|nr:translation elongation factor Ts [Dehalococcoidia bacterium]MDW8009885.1 translation elongation factor Ts [Chloroflexota bacterium]
MAVSAEAVKALRDMTGAGMMDCKRALEEANGDLERAKEILRQRGVAIAERRAGRQTAQGLVWAYVHHDGRVGALVEVNCETDFVARTEEFRALAQAIALQVAAMAPKYVSEEEMPPGEGDPRELCLLSQPYVRDESRTIADLVREVIAKTGENVRVRRFARFELGRYEDPAA